MIVGPGTPSPPRAGAVGGPSAHRRQSWQSEISFPGTAAASCRCAAVRNSTRFCNGNKLHHIAGMTEAYAGYVNGFAIGPQSLACGLAAAMRQPIITPDVIEEPRWEAWRWLAKQFDYRACWSFPVQNSEGKIVGTFAMYYKEPREASAHDLNFAATITSVATEIISPQSPAVR